MEKVKENNYITCPAWAINYVSNTNELLAYSLIYGFTQDSECDFHGSIRYIQEWLMCSKPTAIKVMDSLVKKGLILKEQTSINGVITNHYTAVTPEQFSLQGVQKIDRGCKNSLLGGSQDSLQGSKNSLHNNIVYTNSIDNKNDIKESLQKESKEKEELDLSFIDSSYYDTMLLWFEFKKQNKKAYKTQTGVELCYKKLVMLSEGNPLIARAIVEQSIANNYQGLFALKDNYQNGKSRYSTILHAIDTACGGNPEDYKF